MQIDEKIEEARQSRKRRKVRGHVIWGAAVLLALGSVVALGRHPLVGVATLVMAIAYTGTRLYVDGWDELQRRVAITACAVGCGAGMAWVVIDAIRIAVTGDVPDDPGRTLAITGAAWVTAELVAGRHEDSSTAEERP